MNIYQEIKQAVDENNVEKIKLLLYSHSFQYNNYFYIMEKAVEEGYTEMIKSLLKCKNFNPSCHENYAILHASKNNHIEIVKMLLADSRVDPSVCKNCTIGWASRKGNIEIVKLLLEDYRVDPSDDHNWALYYASIEGCTKMVELLLADPRIDPSYDNHHLVKRVKEKEVLKLLLKDYRVDWRFSNIKEELLKQKKEKLEKEITDVCICIEKAGPQIKFKELEIVKEKSAIPKNIIEKIVYKAKYNEICNKLKGNIPSMKLVVLAGLLKIKYDGENSEELCSKIDIKIIF